MNLEIELKEQPFTLFLMIEGNLFKITFKGPMSKSIQSLYVMAQDKESKLRGWEFKGAKVTSFTEGPISTDNQDVLKTINFSDIIDFKRKLSQVRAVDYITTEYYLGYQYEELA
jgi:hypothetical protein